MPTDQSGKKSKNKKSAKNKAFILLDGISTADMTKEQLEEHVRRLKEELDKEREERNYFQLEKDQVAAYYEISKTQLDQKNAIIRNKEREIEEATEKHHNELKVYKQKMKHLMYEHQNNLTEARADTMVALKIADDEHSSEKEHEWQRRQGLLAESSEKQGRHEAVVKQLKLSHGEEMSALRQEFEGQCREAEGRHERKVRELREEMDVVRRTELASLEERKNRQVDLLVQKHEQAFNDIKNYYNDITISNLALINTLKDQLKEQEKKNERMEKKVAGLEEEKKSLKEPLERLTIESKEMHRRLQSSNKDKATLQTTKSRLKKCEESLKETQWQLEVVGQKFMQVEKERDELYEKFVNAINEVQQKSGLKNVLLEKKLASIHSSLEKKEQQLRRVLQARQSSAAADAGDAGDVTERVDDVIDLKNSVIDSLKYEIARLCKGHNDMVKAYEAKLGEYGLRQQDAGFKPFLPRSEHISTEQIRQGPAGLVSAF